MTTPRPNLASRASIRHAVLLLAMVCGAANAQLQFPVGPPQPKVGDVVKWRVIDRWNDKEVGTSESELVEILPDRFVVRSRRSDNPEPQTIHFTKEWQPCRSMRGSAADVCTGALKFPMQPGEKHSFSRLPWTNGNGYYDATCEVKGQEKVTVPAGAFDTVRIECAGLWVRVFDGNFSGRFEQTFWYAPAVNRTVRDEFTDYRSAGGVFNKTRGEMVEFTTRR